LTTPGVLKLARWKRDPIQFVRDNFHEEPDEWQKSALLAFVNPDPKFWRISLQACAGPGKSTLMAWCALLGMSCYGARGEHPKGAAISVTSDNLKDNLWAEIAKWHNRSEFLRAAFVWTKERYFSRDHPETWFLSARSFSKTANEDEQGRTLSGLHSQYVFIFIDESGEIPISVLKAAEQALSTAKFGKIMQAGNPTSMEGMLFAAATRFSHLWHVIRITGDPDAPDRSPRIPIDRAREQIETHGREDPWVMAYILGKFPPSSINALLGPDEVAAACRRNPMKSDFQWSQKRVGVDVARFGDDCTVLFPRQGIQSYTPVVMRHARTNDIAARIVAARAKWGTEAEFVDDTGGYGAGVIDFLLQSGVGAFPVNFSGKADDPRYYNKRTEMWWRMAEWVKGRGALPDDAQLSRELTAPLYSYQGGKIKLEEKDQIKKRLGFSPDRADALALTFALADMPGSEGSYELHNAASTVVKSKQEFDPFAEA
jgi:hypothetical protein